MTKKKSTTNKIVIHEDITDQLIESLHKIAPNVKVTIGSAHVTWEFEADDESEES